MLSASTPFWNWQGCPHFYWRFPVSAGSSILCELFSTSSKTPCGYVFHPIDSACPFVLLHPLVGAVQISAAHDFLQQSACLSVGIGGVVLGYPLVNKRSCFLFVFRTIPPQTAIATAMFCAFFSLGIGSFPPLWVFFGGELPQLLISLKAGGVKYCPLQRRKTLHFV